MIDPLTLKVALWKQLLIRTELDVDKAWEIAGRMTRQPRSRYWKFIDYGTRTLLEPA